MVNKTLLINLFLVNQIYASEVSLWSSTGEKDLDKKDKSTQKKAYREHSLKSAYIDERKIYHNKEVEIKFSELLKGKGYKIVDTN